MPSGTNTEVEYLPDSSVSNTLDEELRKLLSTCFTKPQDTVFKDQRYFCEPYEHRWVIRDDQNAIVAHIGVHEKSIEAGNAIFPTGGIAEVCVHPDCRGRGYVGTMLLHVHDWLTHRGTPFALLFGNPRVYGSSGYVQVQNLVHGGTADTWKPVVGMMKELSDVPWPTGEVRLPGPKF